VMGFAPGREVTSPAIVESATAERWNGGLGYRATTASISGSSSVTGQTLAGPARNGNSKTPNCGGPPVA
jgi:hypothetical protein